MKKKKLIFDTHAHYDDHAFDFDRDDVITAVLSDNVAYIVNQGTSIETSQYGIALSGKFINMYCAVGIHPENVDEKSIWDTLKIKYLAKHPKVVAIGEIGLDYHWDTPKEMQKLVFSKQLSIARELDMPVNVHDREAHEDVLECLKIYRPKGIVHCFSGSVEMAREIVKLGMYIGMGGVVTFKNARKAVEVVEDTPLERIVLETDCPYLTPEPFRKYRNDSGMIQYVAEKIAEIKKISVEEVLETTLQNAKEIYKL